MLLTKGSPVRNALVLMGGDGLAACLVLSFFNIVGIQEIGASPWQFGFIPIVLLSSFLCEVYRSDKLIFKVKLMRSVTAAIISSLLLLSILKIGGGKASTLAIMILSFVTLQNVWQSLYQKSTASLFFSANVLVIGTGVMAKKVEHLIEAHSGRYSLLGFIRTANDPVTVPEGAIVGHIDSVAETAKKLNAHVIVIALTERRGNLVIRNLVTCKLMGVRIMEYPSFYEVMTGKIPVEDINPSWLVQSSGFLITPFVRLMKRLNDILLASIVLMVTLPFFPLIALLIKISSSGPIFYFQKRVGTNGKLFTIYKFRSMRQDAEKEIGVSWAQEDDPRVTRIGTFMRKTRIDELPQLINVLKGDMSFIGPRPERPEFVDEISKLTPYYPERHAVKPGITGWAQIRYPYGASLGDSVEKLRYDLYYINNLSILLEFIIALETIKVVLFRRGGR